jgi:MYXO-CTERM domain-containing protein
MKKTMLLLVALALPGLALTGCVIENEDGENEVSLSAECTWYAGVECEAACEDFEYHLECEGEMDVECAPECDEFEVDVECTASCQGSCEAECEVDPGSFSCEGYCQGECGANCEAECSAHDNVAACQAECSAFCEGECEFGCEGEPAEVECSGSCSASCDGECTAEANIDCHFCDVDVYVECSQEATIDCQGGCDADGVFECDGEFIDKGDVEDAIAYIESNMPDVEITAEGDASCQGNSCEARGSCEMQCVAAGGDSGPVPAGLALLLAGLAAVFVLGRRR